MDNGVENPRAKEEMDVNPEKRMENQGNTGSAKGKGSYGVTGEF